MAPFNRFRPRSYRPATPIRRSAIPQALQYTTQRRKVIPKRKGDYIPPGQDSQYTDGSSPYQATSSTPPPQYIQKYLGMGSFGQPMYANVPNPAYAAWQQANAQNRPTGQSYTSLPGFPGFAAWLKQNPNGTHDDYLNAQAAYAQQYQGQLAQAQQTAQGGIHDHTQDGGGNVTAFPDAPNSAPQGQTTRVQSQASPLSNLPGMQDYLAQLAQQAGMYGGFGGGGGGMPNQEYYPPDYGDSFPYDDAYPQAMRYQIPAQAYANPYNDEYGEEDGGDYYTEPLDDIRAIAEYNARIQSDINDLRDDRQAWEDDATEEDEDA